MTVSKRPAQVVLGWREWLSLPDLGVARIKAKIDTGARTSALHVDDLERFEKNGQRWVRFKVFPNQRNEKSPIIAEARLVEERKVRSSSGHTELRPVIETTLGAGEQLWRIEITLTSRSLMSFRMLLGRQALRKHVLVNPGASHLTRRNRV